MKSLWNWLKEFKAFFFFLAFAVSMAILFKPGSKHVETVSIEEAIQDSDTTVLDDYVLNKLISLRCPNYYVALTQFKIESGHFSSKLFKDNNNPMGMKYPNVRPTTAKGVRNGYAYYDSVDDAILDYLLYHMYLTKGVRYTDQEYIDLVLKNYAEDPAYQDKVKGLSDKLKTHGDNGKSVQK